MVYFSDFCFNILRKNRKLVHVYNNVFTISKKIFHKDLTKSRKNRAESKFPKVATQISIGQKEWEKSYEEFLNYDENLFKTFW